MDHEFSVCAFALEPQFIDAFIALSCVIVVM